MKYSIFLSVACIVILSCSSKGNKKDASLGIDRKYFDYDNIDYYFNNIEEHKISEQYDQQPGTELDSLWTGVVFWDTPNDSTEFSCIEKLETIGYTIQHIDKSKFKIIDEIFTEKTVGEILLTDCIYVYRDILVFKRKDKVVGVAKICFDCSAHKIIGAKFNTIGFGQNGDYDRLFKIIRN